MIWLIIAGGILLAVGLYKPKKTEENEITITIEDKSSDKKINIRRSDEEAEEGRRVGINGGGYGPHKGWGKM